MTLTIIVKMLTGLKLNNSIKHFDNVENESSTKYIDIF